MNFRQMIPNKNLLLWRKNIMTGESFYVINQNGERIQLDNYDGEWLYEKAAIVDDDVELEDIWILELSTGNDRSRENFEMEFVTDILLTHEPTKDEILRAMVVHGMSIHRDVAIVRHGYRIR